MWNQLSYAIGVAESTSVMVDTFGTGKVSQAKFNEIVRENFKLTPDWIIESLGLRDVSYKPIAKYGHFGIEGRPWEKPTRLKIWKNILKIGCFVK